MKLSRLTAKEVSDDVNDVLNVAKTKFKVYMEMKLKYNFEIYNKKLYNL